MYLMTSIIFLDVLPKAPDLICQTNVTGLIYQET